MKKTVILSCIIALYVTAWSSSESNKTLENTNVAQITKNLIKPIVETKRSTQNIPDADDIAFWIHPIDNTKSLIIGTQKKAGYSIYDVDGKTLVDVNPGNIRLNNVDVIYGYDLGGTSIDIAIFTDRITNKFAIYKISEESPYLTNITDTTSDELFAAKLKGKDTAYGQAVYKSLVNKGKVYAYATRNKYNQVSKFELKTVGNKIGWDKVASLTLDAGNKNNHAEGMVVDQEYGKLYIAQEDIGIYTTDAEFTSNISLKESDLISKEGAHNLVNDLEGVTLYYKDNGEGYFIISSQGNNTYGVFNRTKVSIKNSFIDSFAIVDNMNGIDGSQKTDSIDVTNIAIGTKFPNGAFIVQDGVDTTLDSSDIGTNFKWLKWEDIASKLGDTVFKSSYNPRKPKNRR